MAKELDSDFSTETHSLLETDSAKESHSILGTDSAKETQALETDSAKETQALETDSAKDTQALETDSAKATQALETASAKETQALETDSAEETQALETDSAEETQALETDSAEETHCFAGTYTCENEPTVITLFRRADEEPGYFWKLEQISQGPSFRMPQQTRTTTGRITKLLINENSCTKVPSTWSDARSTLNSIYSNLYWAHYQNGFATSFQYHCLPIEEYEDFVAIAFALRYREEELQFAPLQLNIDVRGSELPGVSHDDMVINVRTGKKVITNDYSVRDKGVKFVGGMAVFTKNRTGMKIREIDEGFVTYLLREFGNGRLQVMSYYNRHHACVFCNFCGIKKPFGRSWCILI